MSKEIIKKEETLPSNLIELAVKNNASLDHLERLMDLQDRWEKKEARKAYYNAMALFQSEKPTIKKDKKADYGGGKAKYNWSSLDLIQKSIDPILSKNGLSYTFETVEENNRLTIICKVTHELGHSEQTQLSAPNDTSGGKNAIQALGSTNSYLRRYTLCNAFGISADEDNDAQTVLKNPPKKLTEKDLKVLDGTLQTITTREKLKELWRSNRAYKVSKEAEKLFETRGIQIEE